MASNSDWTEVDPTALAPHIRERYDAMKAGYRRYAELKKEFEGAMNEAFAPRMSAGTELKFGYMFGRLSVAVGPKREKAAKRDKPSQSLSDWLDAQRQ